MQRCRNWNSYFWAGPKLLRAGGAEFASGHEDDVPETGQVDDDLAVQEITRDGLDALPFEPISEIGLAEPGNTDNALFRGGHP